MIDNQYADMLRERSQKRGEKDFRKDQRNDNFLNSIASVVGTALAPSSLGLSTLVPITTGAVTGHTGKSQQDGLTTLMDSTTQAAQGAAGGISGAGGLSSGLNEAADAGLSGVEYADALSMDMNNSGLGVDGKPLPFQGGGQADALQELNPRYMSEFRAHDPTEMRPRHLRAANRRLGSLR